MQNMEIFNSTMSNVGLNTVFLLPVFQWIVGEVQLCWSSHAHFIRNFFFDICEIPKRGLIIPMEPRIHYLQILDSKIINLVVGTNIELGEGIPPAMIFLGVQFL